MQKIYFSKSTNGFYDSEIHGLEVPKDSVEITKQKHAELLEGQAAGKIIVATPEGFPTLQNPPAITPAQIAAAVTAHRAAAYREESDPLFFKAQRGEATMEEWAAKVAEIKARYPEGVMPK